MTWRDASPRFLPLEVEKEAADGHVSPPLVEKIAARISSAREAYLARLPVAEIVAILDEVIGLWLEAESPWLNAASRRVAAATPYCEAMVRMGVRRLLAGCRKEAMLAVLQAELGDPDALDAFRPRPGMGGMHHATGPALTTHIFSGNVPGLSAVSLIHGLLVKSANLGKPSSEEPIFPALFARSIAAVHPKLAEALAILPWVGGDAAVEAAAFSASEVVVAYGSDASIESIRARVPEGIRFVGHGHRVSFAVVGRDALDPASLADVAERLAYDVSLFDQQGCVSPHVVYVERGGVVSPEGLAERLAEAMAAFENAMPRGKLSLEETQAIRQARTDAELRELRDEPVRVFASPGGTAWSVLYEDDQTFALSCLNRLIRVKPLADLDELPRLVRPVRRYLQTVGAAMRPERRDRLAALLAPLGVCRVCAVGEMPHPPLLWHHDGGFNLLPLLTWTSIEA